MASAAATSYNQNRRVPPTMQIQKILDENAQLISTIQEFQSKGKGQDCVQFQQILHRNLVYLASVADSNQNIQSLLPPPSIALQGMQTQGQHQQLHQQQQPIPAIMGGPEGPNSQSMQQSQQQCPPQQAMNQVFTQGQGQLMPSGGYRPQQTIAPMRPPAQQYRPSPQYQGQPAYPNFATTQSNAVGSSQTGPSGTNVGYNQPPNPPYQGYGHPQTVSSSNYQNANYGNPNPAANQQYQPNGPYGTPPGGNYPQNSGASQPQNFPPNYPPANYVQPVSSSSTYGPGSNQPSSYTGYGNPPQNTYASAQTTSAPSAATQTYSPPTNQSVPNAAIAVNQQPAPTSQPTYPTPQQPNTQSYQPPNNGPNQQPGPPQNYPPQQSYQPPPQGYAQGYQAPGQPSGYQPYSQRPLAPPANQSPYPGYPYQPSPV